METKEKLEDMQTRDMTSTWANGTVKKSQDHADLSRSRTCTSGVEELCDKLEGVAALKFAAEADRCCCCLSFSFALFLADFDVPAQAPRTGSWQESVHFCASNRHLKAMESVRA
jgi:hypothetical protein